MLYNADGSRGSGETESYLPCWDILMQLFLEGLIFLTGGLADGSCKYLSGWILKQNLMI